MKIVRSIPAVLMFVAALSALALSQAYASCTGSDEIGHHNAQCLAATETSQSDGSSTYTLENACPAYGTVVAKVNFGGFSEGQTFTLSSSNRMQRGSASRIDGMYCCKDLGDLCNRSDVVTAANCSSEFNGSDAADSCTLSGTPTVNIAHTNCTFSATCGDQTHTDVTIAYTSMDDLKYCESGFSTAESCPR